MKSSTIVAGRGITADEIFVIRQVVDSCLDLSREELGATVCELLDWKRFGGQLKTRECRDLLEGLESDGHLKLPPKRQGRPKGSRTNVPKSQAGDPGPRTVATLQEVGSVYVERVEDQEKRALFRELIGRHHYLGYRVPFGAQLRYLIWVTAPEPHVVGAMQFSSAAWKMANRDRWIGWNDAARRRNLNRVVNQSRFLILPWFQIKNLASASLARGLKALHDDWTKIYGVPPLLVETLVDPSRYSGTCYRAANWIELGSTAGRGRMDRTHARHGDAPKTLFVYPLSQKAKHELCCFEI